MSMFFGTDNVYRLGHSLVKRLDIFGVSPHCCPVDKFFGPVDGLTEALAAELRAERGRRRVSQMALAAACGRNQSYVSTRLNGHGALTVDEFVAICAAMGIRADELLARVLDNLTVRPSRDNRRTVALAADDHPSYSHSDDDAGYDNA
jgi:transcriptional regulator with XRE-family HTH domain